MVSEVLTTTAKAQMEIADLAIIVEVISEQKIIRLIHVMTMTQHFTTTVIKKQQAIPKLKLSEQERKVFPDLDQAPQRGIT